MCLFAKSGADGRSMRIVANGDRLGIAILVDWFQTVKDRASAAIPWFENAIIYLRCLLYSQRHEQSSCNIKPRSLAHLCADRCLLEVLVLSITRCESRIARLTPSYVQSKAILIGTVPIQQ